MQHKQGAMKHTGKKQGKADAEVQSHRRRNRDRRRISVKNRKKKNKTVYFRLKPMEERSPKGIGIV